MQNPENKNHDSSLTAAEVLRKLNNETLPDFCEPLMDVNQAGTFGNRPIHTASCRGDRNAVAALIAAGADVNARGDLGSTPLHEAAEQGHAGIVQLLLEHGADRNAKNEFEMTPIDVAREHGWEEIVAILNS